MFISINNCTKEFYVIFTYMHIMYFDQIYPVHVTFLLIYCLINFWLYWGVKSGCCTCSAGTLPLEPYPRLCITLTFLLPPTFLIVFGGFHYASFIYVYICIYKCTLIMFIPPFILFFPLPPSHWFSPPQGFPFTKILSYYYYC
jgi:hypothetical protein